MIYSKFDDLADITKSSKIKNYNDKYKCKYNIEKCSSMVGRSINLFIDCNRNDYHKDAVLNKFNYVKIAGTVRNNNSNNVSGICVTLYRFEVVNYKTEYIPVADTVSDKDGTFQFIIPDNKSGYNFKVKVNDFNNEH